MTKWLSIAARLAPLVLTLVPGLPVALVPLIVEGIQEAEQIRGASGSAKKAHVRAVVRDGITVLNTTKKGEVLDPARVDAVVDKGIDTTIGVINLVHDAGAGGAQKKR